MKARHLVGKYVRVRMSNRESIKSEILGMLKLEGEYYYIEIPLPNVPNLRIDFNDDMIKEVNANQYITLL